MNTSLKFTTLIQRLNALRPESILKADDELAKHVNLGFRVVSETILPGDEILTRVIRLEGEQPASPPEPETSIGKLVREHGAERANQILQQEMVDRMRGVHEARKSFYQEHPVQLPVFLGDQ